MPLRPSAIIGAAFLLAALAAASCALSQYSPLAMRAEDVQILKAFPSHSVQQLAAGRDVLLRCADSSPVVWGGWFLAYVSIQVRTAMDSKPATTGAHRDCRLLPS